eukprot:CAMPEP_0118904982 /NCGR_PEP_ID=MMETSP1166-20130328/9218_1 /TAXON_ID=1104430 /ORGANISM="Chrysoreinhardia sp, Strain CCMP3193" /LENGTH=375 /DNA_ID=CAMNT_0006844251 /DNA_START=28 /DNA_END=1155 /DNA_ORIENTATION=+
MTTTLAKRLTAEVDKAEAVLVGVPSASSLAAVVASLESEGVPLKESIRKKLEAVDRVTGSAYLAVLAAARADAREAGPESELQRRLEELEARREDFAEERPRYGSSTRAKAEAVVDRFDAVLRRARVALSGTEDDDTELLLEEDRRVAAEVADAARRALVAASDVAVSFIPVEPRVADLGLGVQDELLEAKEETKRQRELTERKRRRELTRREEMDKSKRAPRGPAALRSALRSSALDQEATAHVPALARVVAAISESPDDERRRKLRCSHDAFKRDFGDPLPPPIQAAIEAVGFTLLYRAKEKKTGPPPASSSSPPRKHDDDEEEEDEEEPFFIMREPDPMTDLDAWSAWFDSLTACKAYLDEVLASGDVSDNT